LKGERPAKRAKQRRRRLELEPLETREVLSVTFTPGPYAVPAHFPDVARPAFGVGVPLPGFWSPKILVNPTNPSNIVLSQAEVLEVSTDGGASYTQPPNLPFGEGALVGDTTLVFDSHGHLFWAESVWNGDAGGAFALFVTQLDPTTGVIGQTHQVTTPTIETQPDGTPFGDEDNLPSLAADTSGNLVMTWEHLTLANVQVLVARSTDQGQTWSTPLTVSAPDDEVVGDSGPTVSVAAGGDVYVAYHPFVDITLANNPVFVVRFSNDLTMRLATSNVFGDGGATMGSKIFYGPTWVLADPTRPGQVYVVSTDNAGDLVFARSPDNGQTWMTSTLVPAGRPTTFSQTLPTLVPTAAIDQFGDIAVAWLDCGAGLTDATGNSLFNVAAMYSTDGGQSWSPSFQVNDVSNSFDVTRWDGSVALGINLFGGTCYLAWAGDASDHTGHLTGLQVWTNSFGLNGSLMVTDDGSSANTITVAALPGNPADVEVLVNDGSTTRLEYAGLASGLTGITINAGNAGDTVNIENTFAGVPVTINLGGGTDTVHVTPTAKALDNLLADVTINGGPGIDTLVADDSGHASVGRTYDLQYDANNQYATLQTFDPLQVGSGLGQIHYTNMANVVLNTAQGTSQTPDTINLRGAVAGSTVTVNGGANDQLVADFAAGNPLPPAGLTFTGGGGTNSLAVLGDAYRYAIDNPTGPAAGSLILEDSIFSSRGITYANVQAITEISAPALGAFTLPNYLTFNAPAGPGVLTVSDGTSVSGLPTTQVGGTTPGTSSPTFATLTFANRTFATVNSAIAADVLTVNTAQAAAELAGLTVNAPADNNPNSSHPIYVLGTAAGVSTTINATSGWYTIHVGLPTPNLLGTPGNPLDAIQGAVTVNGGTQTYADSLMIDDTASRAVRTYTVGATSISAGANLGPISWQGLLHDVDLFGSAAADTYLVQSLPTDLATLQVIGVSGNNTVQSALAGNHTWWLYPSPNIALDPELMSVGFRYMTNLIGGPGSDTFRLIPEYNQDGGLSGVLDGGGGGDWLDCSRNINRVTVNLTPGTGSPPPGQAPTGLASGIGGGVRNIQNVIGSLSANNMLTGNTQSAVGGILIGGNGHDLLTAGLGRSILVAEGGTSTLIGGGADDILIGGYTNYDHRLTASQAVNTAAWLAILAEWQRTDRTYGQRLHDLRAGGGLNGTAVLVWGASGTVHDNGVSDVLQGDPTGTPGDLDWFFRGRRDVFAIPVERGEQINNG
jgi:hypothetical protein